MTPEKLHLPTAYRNNTYSEISFTFSDVDNYPVDLTDASVRMEFRQKGDLRKCYDTYDGTIVISDTLLGTVKIPEHIIDLDEGVYVYDITVTFPSGKVKTYYRGRIEVVGNITERRIP